MGNYSSMIADFKQRASACLLGMTLFVSGCGGNNGDGAERTEESLPTSTTPLTTTPTVPPTTQPTTPIPSTTPPTVPPTSTTTSTTVPERHEEAPHLFDLVVADGEWSSEMQSDPRFATLRAGPGDTYPTAARISVPRLAIEGTGGWTYDDQGVFWRELYLGFGSTAWVEGDRLEINLATQVDIFDHPCATEGAAQGSVPITGPLRTSGADEPADHVAQLWHSLGGPACDRLHLALGTEWDYDSGGPLASGVPEGVTVEAFGSWARITVPGLTAARVDALAELNWNLTSIVARAADRSLMIDLYAPQQSLFAAQALRDPARLVVDVIPTSGDGSTTPASVGLRVSRTTFVPWRGLTDADSPLEVAIPLTVRGYSRWFEAGGIVEIQHVDGTPATANLTGPRVVNPGTGSRWGVTATDYLEAWGTFEFTVDGAAPGEYRLLVGEYPPINDRSFVGVTIPINVSAPA